MHGKLLDGTNGKILLDTGMSKSFMSKRFYLNCPSLHFLQKFALKPKSILVRNGQCISVLFVIPAVANLHGHRFQLHTLI